MRKEGFLLMVFALLVISSFSQTNPAPQTLPFALTGQTGTVLPAGVAVHRFGTSAAAIPLTRTVTPGNADLLYATAGSTSGGWRDETTNGLSMLASGAQAAGAWVVSINTTGITN